MFGISRQKETHTGTALLGQQPGLDAERVWFMAARGNRFLKIQTGAKTKLVKLGQALWPLLCVTFSQMGSGEEPSQCEKLENEGYSIQSREWDARLGKVRVGERTCPERTGECAQGAQE